MTRAIPTEAISFEQHWDRADRFGPPELFDSLRRERLLTRMTYPDGHLGWLVTSYDLVREVLSNPRFSHKLDIAYFPVTRNGQPIPPLPIMPGMFIHMDPPEHTRYRRLLTGEFTFRPCRSLRPMARQFISRKQADPGDDLMSRLIAPGELTDEELANILPLLFVAGYVTTEGALAAGLFALLAHPGQLATLRAERQLGPAVEELLRYTSVNQYELRNLPVSG